MPADFEALQAKWGSLLAYGILLLAVGLIAKEISARFEQALGLRYREQAAAARQAQGKDTGAVRIADGDVTVVAELPKRVEWDQDELAAMVARIEAAGVDPAEYVETSYRVSERKYAAWPESIREGFAAARTVRTGKPTSGSSPGRCADGHLAREPEALHGAHAAADPDSRRGRRGQVQLRRRRGSGGTWRARSIASCSRRRTSMTSRSPSRPIRNSTRWRPLRRCRATETVKSPYAMSSRALAPRTFGPFAQGVDRRRQRLGIGAGPRCAEPRRGPAHDLPEIGFRRLRQPHRPG